MYIIKNALRNITRNLGRNILLSVIILVIAISSCLALSIKEAGKTAKEEALENLTITASIGVDRDAIMKKAQAEDEDMSSAIEEYPNLTLDELEVYAASDYVKNFYYSKSTSLSASDSISAVTSSSNADNTAPATGNSMPGIGSGSSFTGMGMQGDFTLTGYSGEDAMTDFISGTNKVEIGSIFDFESSDHNCIISQALATLNSLSVGDSIVLVNPNASDESYTFTISGIYTSSSQSDAGQGMMGFSTSNDPDNQIYVSIGTLNEIYEYSSENATTGTSDGAETTTALRLNLNGTYTFKDVSDYENFALDVKKLGLSDEYLVSSSDLTSYESSLTPINNLTKFANIFLIVVLIVGAIILIVLNIFSIRERKYEIGVLSAIGMEKKKIVFQFVSELLIVAFVATIVGTGIGAIASVPTANSLLAAQIESSQNQQQQRLDNFGTPPSEETSDDVANEATTKDDTSTNQVPMKGFNNIANYITQINASTNLIVVLKIMGIGLILTLLSSLVSVITIARYEPLKILSDRS